MKVLLVYEEIPESIDFYEINDPSENEIAILRKCHKKYVNLVNTDDIDAALIYVSDALCDKPENCSGENVTANCKWTSSKIDSSAPFTGAYDLIITTGFLL